MKFQQKVLIKTSLGWRKGLFWRSHGKNLEIRVVTKNGVPYEAIANKAGEYPAIVASPAQVRLFENQSEVDGEEWLTK